MIVLELAEYDPRWPHLFEAHRRRIAAALGERATRIEHIGSTAVPGLAAKPVIDIQVEGVTHDEPSVRTALEAAGYEPAVDEPGHRMFKTAERDAHVHLWADPADAQRHLVFRDWLRSHPDDRALYEHVKRELSKREWRTRDHYADAKTAVVRTIMRRANGEVPGPRVAQFADALLRHLPERSRVLEIGAGEGLLASRLAAAGHDVVALDTDLRSTFAIVESSFEDYDAPPQSFDCIVAQLVLHHAADLDAMVDKIARLLKAGGLIAIDDYGWERSDDPSFRAERSDLHTSGAMLAALRARYDELSYADHALLNDGAGDDELAFTFLGTKRSR